MVRIDPLFQASDPARTAGACVTFEPGASIGRARLREDRQPARKFATVRDRRPNPLRLSIHFRAQRARTAH
jgi:hypothetical protein